MSVEHILAEKGRDTITIAADQSLADAVAILDRHRIGAIVVVDAGGGVQGILSERDIVRAVAAGEMGALSQPVSSRMSTRVVTCKANAPIDELMQLMTDNKFRHVPVVENGRLAGMVSIGDIVKHRLAEMEAEHKALRDYIATA